MVLAHLALNWMQQRGAAFQIPLAVAHMNFSLRGEESLRDQAFVCEWAKQLQIPFYTQTVDALQTAERLGISVEMAARDLRYDWFEQLCIQLGFSCIAVAHNANDRAETMLLNQLRGTGLRGASGIPRKTGRIIRPLLDVTRPEIAAYAAQHGIGFCEDCTNAQTLYARNKIRHLVMPVLEEITPHAVERMCRNADYLCQSQQLVDALWREKRPKLEVKGGFSVPALLADGQGEYWLFLLLQPYGFASAQIKAVFRSMQGQSGKRFYSRTHSVWVDRLVLQVRKLSEGSCVDKAPKVDWVVEEREAGAPLPAGPNEVWLDADRLDFPLTLRPWQTGDRLMPLGMQGFKKVSDLLVDLKVPLAEKQNIHVLCSAQDIVWVVGRRLDDRFKVTESTTRICKVRLL